MIEIIPNWHPIFVHFTVTLITFSGFIQCFIWLMRPQSEHPVWVILKFINITGLIAVIITVLSGYHAYSTVAHDSVSHLAMSTHRNWAIATLIIFVVGAIFSLLSRKKLIALLSGFFLVLACLLVIITAYKGGELVYRYGLGVLSLPETETDHGNHHTPDSHHHQQFSTDTIEPHHNDEHSH